MPCRVARALALHRSRPGSRAATAQVCEYYLAEVEKNGGGRQEARPRPLLRLHRNAWTGADAALCCAEQIPSVLTTPLNYIFHIEVRTCAAGPPLPRAPR